MTSILTNAGATSALQTLRAIGSDLGRTQNQVSSGLRVQIAADNAAYWSISTTMRSDNMAISAVSDAMALGAAKTDTAYSGTESVIDILKAVKAKLVAASEDSVDKAKIQEELNQLADQAESVVNASSFSGVNWLKTQSATHIMDADVLSDKVVSAFVRTADGSVSVKSAEVDLRETSMLNEGGGGILQKDLLDYYMPMNPVLSSNSSYPGYEDHMFTGPRTFGALDEVTFDLVVDRTDTEPGMVFNVVVDKAVIDLALTSTNGVIADTEDLHRVLRQAFDNAGASPYMAISGAYGLHGQAFNVRSLETTTSSGSSIYFETFATTFVDANPNRFLGLDGGSSVNMDNMHPNATMTFAGPFKVMLDATIDFDMSIDGNPLKTYTIDRDAVDNALGTTDGIIGSAADMKTVIDYLAAVDGLEVTTGGSAIGFRADQTVYPGYGYRAVDFYISSFRPDPPFILRFDLDEIDITTSAFSIDEYLEGVEFMLKEATSSASTIGSLQARIDLQSTFISRLSDSIDSGIGRLVDADMNEASTRLKALQTQEQLAIQSLQIANTNSESILSLFR